MAQAQHRDAPLQQWTTAQLVDGLRAWDVSYLTQAHRGERAAAEDRISKRPPISALLRALARADEPRVRDALIGLLLLHPEVADEVVQFVTVARAQGRDDLAERVITLALAAVYLQRIWWFQWTLAYGAPPQLDETPFRQWLLERSLPAPAIGYGEPGLRRLADYERERTGMPTNYIGDWQNQAQHALDQGWSRRLAESQRTNHVYRPGLLAFREAFRLAPHEQGERDTAMSFRPDVSRDDIEQFLQQFGRLSQQPGRLYLAGGAELVHSGLRGEGGTTVDIDLRMDVSDTSAAETIIRQLMRQLGVNVEFASPADFIPLPSDWAMRSPFVGRYGNTDVFYFDYYALALSKISRGTSRDLSDIVLLAEHGLIVREELEAAYQQVLPQLGHGRFFNIDPTVFTEHYEAALAMLPETH